MNLKEAITAATTEPDLDKALVPIQDALGQTDGGHASVFFSGPNGDNWETMTPEYRRELLLDYVASEVTHMGIEEPDHDDEVKCCPDCERPNQFGELCSDCQRERAIDASEPRDIHDAPEVQTQTDGYWKGGY